MKKQLIRAFVIAAVLASLATQKAWAEFCSGYLIWWNGVEICCETPDGCQAD